MTGKKKFLFILQTKIFFLLIFLLTFSFEGKFSALRAEENSEKNEDKRHTPWGDIARGLGSSFSIPLSNLMDPDSSDRISAGVGFIAPLHRTYPTNEKGYERQGQQATNYALTAGITYNPLSYWFINITGYKYLDNAYKAPWHPEFSYRMGYDDWHPYTLSFIYGNYGGNRIFPDENKKEKFTRFDEGTFSLGWKFPLPENIADIFLIDTTSAINHMINFNVTPTYTDYATQNMRKWKKSLSFSTYYGIYGWWYLNFSLYYYPNISERQPWDPDFTYGFGYFDWHPGTISVQYNNYAGNRYPWSRETINKGKFLDGSLSVTWTTTF